MKIKRLLLVALTALGLSLASVGVVGPAITGSKPSVISGNTAGLTAPPAIAGRCGGCSGTNFRSPGTTDAPAIAGSKPSVAPGQW